MQGRFAAREQLTPRSSPKTILNFRQMSKTSSGWVNRGPDPKPPRAIGRHTTVPGILPLSLLHGNWHGGAAPPPAHTILCMENYASSSPCNRIHFR